MLKQVQNTKWEILLLILFLLPLFWINLNNKHDWGDDFAQYLLQAKCMTGESNSGLVSQLNNYGPDSKGLLFSVLLIPATWSDTKEIFYSKILVTVTLVLVALLLQGCIRNKAGKIASIFFTLFFIYNFHILELKDQILPDFAFLSILLCIVLLTDTIETSDMSNYFLATVVAIVSVGFRSVGLIAVLALGCTLLVHSKKLKINSSQLLKVVLILFSAFVIFLSWFQYDKGTVSWYLNLISSHSTIKSIADNLYHYKEGFKLFYELELPFWLNMLLLWSIFPAILVGLFRRLFKLWRFLDFFTVFYLLLILFYPYNNEPTRFLLPLLACGLIYAVEGFYFVCNLFTSKYQNPITVLIALFFVICTVKSTAVALKDEIVYSPYSNSTKELFKYIDREIPVSEKISFSKPWALAYFTNHSTVPQSEFKMARWLIQYKNASDGEFSVDTLSFQLTFNNADFSVYKVR